MFVVGVICCLFVVVKNKPDDPLAKTDQPYPTTLMDGQRVGALQTRLSWVG
jgi:hypothetical protein